MTAGSFIWYELMTTDIDAAAKFYGDVLGWRVADTGSKDGFGGAYRFFYAGDAGIGGLMALPENMRAMNLPPAWYGYVAVDDVDATLAAMLADGGKKYMERDEPGVGRFANIADPQGADLYIMKPAGAGASRAFAPGKPGHVGWNEYHGKDGEAALAFYTRHFGWAHDGALDMGPMGKYHLFSIDGAQAGGILTEADFPHPAWLFYFVVDDIAAAKARIEKAGGTVIHGPHQVPGGQLIILARDPQGGMFAVVTAPVAE